MCNRYEPVEARLLLDLFGSEPDLPYLAYVAPWKRGPIVRASRLGKPECRTGLWGLIRDRQPVAVDRRYQTNNARWEDIEKRRTFAGPWSRGQRCLIPAWTFDEPNWESGKAEWWRLARADGAPWCLAGLWNEWVDPQSGQVTVSYTMLTTNCDGHPLLARLHRSLPPNAQDKRTPVSIEREDWETWLYGSVEEADRLRRVLPVDAFRAGPAAGFHEQRNAPPSTGPVAHPRQ